MTTALHTTRAERVHHALLRICLAGGGLAELVAELAAELGCPVLLTGADGDVVHEAGKPEDLVRATEYGCFDAEDGRLHLVHRTRSGAAHPRPPHVGVPIVVGGVERGRLVAFVATRGFEPTDLGVLDRAVLIVALAMAQDLAVSELEKKYQAGFLRDLLTGVPEDPHASAARAAAVGWDVERDLVVVVAELDPAGSPEHLGRRVRRQRGQERFSEAWARAVGRRDPHAPVADIDHQVVVLLGLPEWHADPDRRFEAVDASVGDLAAGLSRNTAGRDFSIGVSAAVRDLAGLPAAYEAARRAVSVGRVINGPASTTHFERLGVYRLLWRVSEFDELRSFAVDTLKGLSDETDAGAAELRATLEALFEMNLNMTATARRLRYHTNTVRYRTAKIERIVGPFLDRPDLRLDLMLALRILRMRGI
jgi:purine catabolism regulator